MVARLHSWAVKLQLQVTGACVGRHSKRLAWDTDPGILWNQNASTTATHSDSCVRRSGLGVERQTRQGTRRAVGMGASVVNGIPEAPSAPF